MTMSKSKEARIFKEACNGFGFQEIDQTPEGIWCDGCSAVHKRPTKMYSNAFKGVKGEKLCRYQVVRLYNPEE